MQVFKTVNFGSRKSGLSTVGYTLYNTNNTVYQARTNEGVSEFEDGIYGVTLNFSSTWTGLIIWDTGDSRVLYATESFTATVYTRSQDETGTTGVVYRSDITNQLRREVGDTDSGNLYYNSDTILGVLSDGLSEFNEEMPQQYSEVYDINQDDYYYSPTPGRQDKCLIVLYAARVLLRGELSKQARDAIVHTNSAGKTDLSKRPEWTAKVIENYNSEIRRLRTQREQELVGEELGDGGGSMELRNSNTDSALYVEGLPITIINRTV